eukprot:862158-Pyramimonas_sp.AAC.1
MIQFANRDPWRPRISSPGARPFRLRLLSPLVLSQGPPLLSSRSGAVAPPPALKRAALLR